ncbi:MAG: hypothetical protein ERJ68_05590 [Aphanocapsa feldmannii 277cI]|uniref:Uncharacterized protein n=1 Tax=Aphanocapsa feldmannii 277cI TaxID=2507554 RepID=A0A524RUB2_9CHRO|nr:MAG: hypothetical protein ERJ68_05590 [Aphanocapsa feldmannii 277cI]
MASSDRHVAEFRGLVDWVNGRIASLDATEDYEASYALTQEFSDWILGDGEDTVLAIANPCSRFVGQEPIGLEGSLGNPIQAD